MKETFEQIPSPRSQDWSSKGESSPCPLSCWGMELHGGEDLAPGRCEGPGLWCLILRVSSVGRCLKDTTGPLHRQGNRMSKGPKSPGSCGVAPTFEPRPHGCRGDAVSHYRAESLRPERGSASPESLASHPAWENRGSRVLRHLPSSSALSISKWVTLWLSLAAEFHAGGPEPCPVSCSSRVPSSSTGRWSSPQSANS